MKDLYSRWLELPAGGEYTDLNFFGSAFMIRDRALSRQSIQQVVLAEEEKGAKSLFHDIRNMQAILDKASTPSDIEFCFCALVDYHESGRIGPGIEERQLRGSPLINNGVGLVDLFCYKRRRSPPNNLECLR